MRVQVDDGHERPATQTYELFVNGPSTIVSTPVTQARVEVEYRYDIEATDPNEDRLT